MPRYARPMFKNTKQFRKLAAEKMVNAVRRLGVVFPSEQMGIYKRAINTKGINNTKIEKAVRIAFNDAASMHSQVHMDVSSNVLIWINVGKSPPTPDEVETWMSPPATDKVETRMSPPKPFIMKESTMKNYIVLSESRPDRLSREVTKHLDDGWVLRGDVVVSLNNDGERLYTQALTMN